MEAVARNLSMKLKSSVVLPIPGCATTLKPNSTIDPVDQGSERFPVGLTVEEEPGVGCIIQGVFRGIQSGLTVDLYRICGDVVLQGARMRQICCKSMPIAEKPLGSRIWRIREVSRLRDNGESVCGQENKRAQNTSCAGTMSQPITFVYLSNKD